MIQRGPDNILRVYLGATNVVKVYLGLNEVMLDALQDTVFDYFGGNIVQVSAAPVPVYEFALVGEVIIQREVV